MKRKPLSMSDVIFVSLELGPKPLVMKYESTLGRGLPRGVAAVVAGFGVVTFESLLLR